MKQAIEDRPRVRIRTDLDSIRNLLSRNRNKFFGVKFIKRTTGLPRTLNVKIPRNLEQARFKVNLKDKNLFPIFDVKGEMIKTIPLDSLLEVRMEGRVYVLNQPSLTTK